MIRPGIRNFFRIALRRGDVILRNVDDEIRAHLDLRTEQLVREGFSPEAARVEAERRFGSVGDARRDLQQHAQHRERTMQFREWIEALRQDVRYAVRGLRREPLFAAFVIVTLALGIGANAAMFGVADRLLLRGPEHIVAPDRVMRVYLHEVVPGEGEFSGNTFGYVMYDVLAHGAHTFDGVAAYVASPHNQTILGHGTDARLIQQGQATSSLFPMLGVTPALGRFFTAEEDSRLGAQRVAVISYALWQRDFEGNRSVLGKSVLLRDVPYTIVGVAPRGFTGPQLAKVDVWLPASLHVTMSTRDDWSRTWHVQWMEVVVRLKPGITREQAAVDATAAYQHAYNGGSKEDAHADLFVAPLSYNDDGKESTEVSVSRWLVGVAFVVLLIACSNVANLLLARAVRRRREVAVRLALGAGRRRLLQLLLTESLTLAALGGAAGLAIAWLTAQFMRGVLLSDVEWTSSPVDGRVLAVTAVIALGVGILTGLVPALRASRPDLTSSLKSGVREGGMQGAKLRAALSVAQAALSIVLLAGAGLFAKSLSSLRSLDLGMQPGSMLVVSPRWAAIAPGDSAAQAAERARRERVLADALDQVRRLHGIEAASLAIGLPFRSGYQQFLRVPGWDSIPHAGGDASVSAVTSGYFASAGTRLLGGRVFTAADRVGSEPVAIVSDLMARTLWPKGDAIGQCLYTSPTRTDNTICARIVGIVADVHRFRLREKPSMHYYIPFGQERGMGGTYLVMRPHGDPSTAIPELRTLVQRLDPTIEFVDASTLQSDIDPEARPWRLGATVFGMMGVLALLVAAVGLYSVMSYLVAQRTHELGVRIALGASGGNIVAIVLRSSVGMTLLGIGIGLGLALAAGRFIEPLLYGTSSRDAGVLGGVSAAMLAVAVMAAVIPAMRAKRTDPMEALRAD
jgi:predicted permease